MVMADRLQWAGNLQIHTRAKGSFKSVLLRIPLSIDNVSCNGIGKTNMPGFHLLVNNDGPRWNTNSQFWS